MRIEGIQPNHEAPGEKGGGAKASPRAGGKSFGAALEKAAAALSPNPNPPAVPNPAIPDPVAPAAPPGAMASESGGPPGATEPPPADPLEMIRFRMKTGYYNSKALDDALTDKLTGFFDDLT